MSYFRNVILLLVLLSAPVAVSARKVRFEVRATRLVMVGEQFKVNYVADADIENFSEPDFGDIEVLAGPVRTMERSITVKDGETVTKDTCIYAYLLVCNSPGMFKVTGVSAKIDGKKYNVRSVSIRAQSEKAGEGYGYKKRIDK